MHNADMATSYRIEPFLPCVRNLYFDC